MGAAGMEPTPGPATELARESARISEFENARLAHRQVWLADLTHTGRGVASDSVPLGIGFLAAYLRANIWFDRPIRLFRYPEALAAALDSDPPPDLLGFSTYSWNARLSRLFAREARKRNNRTAIVFGGPDFPLTASERTSSLLDAGAHFFVENEGEPTLINLLRALEEADWDIAEVTERRIPSVHAVDRYGRYWPPDRLAPRLVELDVIPSPYLTGLMDQFLDGFLIPALQTNRGCPFSCTFCTEGSVYYNKVRSFSGARIISELRYIAQQMQDKPAARKRNELLITDSNFAMYPQDAVVCREIGELREKYGWPARVNVTTGKNKRERILESVRLAGGAIQLSGAVQSLDNQVLENIDRKNIRSEDLARLGIEAADTGTPTYSDVILGLPGDTLGKHKSTVLSLIDAGFARINTFQFMLLGGASIASPVSRSRFSMKTKFRVIPRSFGIYKIFGSETPSAEVEEVCVETDTMSFEDYIAARQFDLTVSVFHNDGAMTILEQALLAERAMLGEWIERIDSYLWKGRLGYLRRAFVGETAAQLYASPAEAEAAFTLGAERYLRGKAGNNLLYTYRARCLREALDELSKTAMRAALDLGCKHADFLREAALCDEACLSDILYGKAFGEINRTVEYDFLKLIEDGGRKIDITQIVLEKPRDLAFRRSRQVDELLRDYQATLGESADSMGRALSRIAVADIRRVMSWAEEPTFGYS
jgi:radical SAM superfamily enzyme YgiQ (UPF0313 family)